MSLLDVRAVVVYDQILARKQAKELARVASEVWDEIALEAKDMAARKRIIKAAISGPQKPAPGSGTILLGQKIGTNMSLLEQKSGPGISLSGDKSGPGISMSEQESGPSPANLSMTRQHMWDFSINADGAKRPKVMESLKSLANMAWDGPCKFCGEIGYVTYVVLSSSLEASKVDTWGTSGRPDRVLKFMCDKCHQHWNEDQG